MTNDTPAAPLTDAEIEALRKWLHGGVEYWSGPRGNDPEWVAACTNALRALDELEALRAERDTSRETVALQADAIKDALARLEAVEADTARLDFIERMGGAVLGPVDSNILPGESWVCDVSESGHPDQWDVGPGLRGAIDEAIRAQAQIEARAALAPGSTQGATDG